MGRSHAHLVLWLLSFLGIVVHAVPPNALQPGLRPQAGIPRPVSAPRPPTVTVPLKESGLQAEIKRHIILEPWRMKRFADKIIGDARQMTAATDQSEYYVWPSPDVPYLFTMKKIDSDGDIPINRDLLFSLGNLINEQAAQGETQLFDGVVWTDDDDMAIEFEVERVPTLTYQSPGQLNEDLAESDLKIIYDVKAQIIQHTSPEDLIFFLGNGGGYFDAAFNYRRDKRKNVLIPFEQMDYLEEITDELVRQYTRNVLDEAFKNKRFQRLYIVDFGVVPKRLQQFVDIVMRSGWMEKKGKIFDDIGVLPLLPASSPYLPNQRQNGIYYGEKIQAGSGWGAANRFFDARIKRIVVPYVSEYWDIPWRNVPYPDKAAASTMFRAIRDYSPIYNKLNKPTNGARK
ncbi:MAG: hypothetical protein M1833_003403 [Piccolia ochrophora]|nr:MAG: hypothetical protein M1833_003403 [Piccolia ochrophora]